MKLYEYIHTPNVLDTNNIITLHRIEKIAENIVISNDNSGRYLFLNLSEDLLEYQDLNEILKQINDKIIFIFSCDIDFPPPIKPYSYDKYFDESKLPENHLEINYYEKINTELLNIIQKNNIHIYTHSLSINHSNITNVPIGIYEKFNHFQLKTNEKTILCYANFGIPCDRWFGNPRKELISFIKDKDFILIENIFEKNPHKYTNDYFYDKISRSKFTLCPRGSGIDTYRLWDSICLGSIPIVEKYDGHAEFIHLPILFVDSYEEINEDFLNKKYELFSKQDFCYDKMKIEYWDNLFSKITHTDNYINPAQPFGAYLQCYKNPFATFICLMSFRNFYPNSTVVLLSDNGYDYTEMANYFNCIYIHSNETLLLTYKDIYGDGKFDNSFKLIERVVNAFKLCKEEYVMWLEDDVHINNKINDTFKYHINGFCQNRFLDFQLIELNKTYVNIDINYDYRFSGHGGSIFHKDFFISSMNNKAIIHDVLENWVNYKFPTDIGQDFLFSLIVTLSGGNIGPYKGHLDYHLGINPDIDVQHQFKHFYNVPLPDELSHLVKM